MDMPATAREDADLRGMGMAIKEASDNGVGCDFFCDGVTKLSTKIKRAACVRRVFHITDHVVKQVIARRDSPSENVKLWQVQLLQAPIRTTLSVGTFSRPLMWRKDFCLTKPVLGLA